ncbi:short chain dehydrogenase reductase family protein [Cryptosporidium andersoni]|uniref:Short chain dehydrogenase reductase family protein n=1 Tax=Cryptosporidium andersoni TaxID=117008 RepID=A0A1J4MNQ6_9CRYT|nr:short chain dehydrogenase reductase family protein [Cryptosporidium andersoni]
MINLTQVLFGITYFISALFSLFLAIIPIIWSLIVSLISKDSDFVLGCIKCQTNPEYFFDKVIWITGPSSGIGKAIVLDLARISLTYKKEIYLILSARNIEPLKSLKNHLITEYQFSEENIQILLMDLSDLTQIDNKVTYAKNWKGKIDILFNNAGLRQKSILEDFESDYKILSVNGLGCMKLAKKVLLKCFIPQKSGHLVNTNSIQGYVALPGRCAYGASKRACLGYFDSLKYELSSLNWQEYSKLYLKENNNENLSIYDKPNIVITNLFPGYIQTDIDKRAIYISGKSINLEYKKQKGLKSIRCSELIIRAVSNRIEEAWIAKPPELIFMYLTYYSPSFSSLMMSFMAKSFTKQTWEIQKLSMTNI